MFKKIQKSIISMVLLVAMANTVLVGSFANPIVIPLIEGALGLFTAVAVSLGLQTSDSSDFSEIFGNLSSSDRLKFTQGVGLSTFVLSKTTVDLVKTKLVDFVPSINANHTLPKIYRAESKGYLGDAPVTKVGFETYTSKPLPGVGLLPVTEFFSVTGLNTSGYTGNRTKAVKVDGVFIRLIMSGGNIISEVSSDGVNWSVVWSTFANNGLTLAFNTSTQAYDKTSLRFGKDENHNLVLQTCVYGTNPAGYKYINYTLKKNEVTKANFLGLATAVAIMNATRSVNVLPVDETKLYDKTIDATKTYSDTDVTYNDDEIKPTSLTSVDPITKSPAGSGTGTGTATGSTTVDLTDVKANLSNLVNQANASNTQNYNFFTWIKTFLQSMLTAILGISNPIVTAIQAVTSPIVSAIQAVTSPIVSAIQDVVIPIVDAVNSVPTKIVTAIQGISSPIVTAIQAITSPIISAIQSVVTPIVNAISSVPSTIVTAIQALPTTIVTAIQAISTSIISAITSVPGAIVSVLNAMTQPLLDIRDFVMDMPSAILTGLQKLFVPDIAKISASFLVLQGVLTAKLGAFMQAYGLLVPMITQNYDFKKPKFTIKLDPPFGDGSVYEIINLDSYEQYRPGYMLLASSFIWFMFIRKIAMSNPFRGGGDS